MSEHGIHRVSPEMVEGPFYAHGGPHRADIREGQPGADLELVITVRDAITAQPVEGVTIDLWQPNATGHYSGYDMDPDAVPTDISTGQPPANDETFLRGWQATDADGCVTFTTIYPGWYRLRTPHIHLKVIEDGQCNLTTQLYFPEAISEVVYRRPEYARNSPQDTFNQSDPVIATTSGEIESLWIDVEAHGGGFKGSATLWIVPGNVNDPIHPPPGRIPPVGGRPHDKRVR